MHSLVALAAAVHLAAVPATSLSDAAVTINASGLRPHATVTVRLASTDADGVHWVASDSVSSSAHGTIHISAGPLFHALHTRGLAIYAWHGTHAQTFTVRIGRATTTFTRRLYAEPVLTTQLTLAADGVLGTFFTPLGARRHAAVLAFGGSEGGLQPYLLTIAQHLAANGYPTLALAYWNAPGLPPSLTQIPLEYFTHALGWLAARPEVAPARMSVLGVSRGSEAAELLGANFPALVHSVVAVVPSNVANGPAWTLGGATVPYTNDWADPHPVDNPDAEIPVERTRGPIFAACAFDDDVWPSCQYASAMILRLRAARHPYHDVLVASLTARHTLGQLVPYRISSSPPPDYDEEGYDLVWPKLLAFLKAGAS